MKNWPSRLKVEVDLGDAGIATEDSSFIEQATLQQRPLSIHCIDGLRTRVTGV